MYISPQLWLLASISSSICPFANHLYVALKKLSIFFFHLNWIKSSVMWVSIIFRSKKESPQISRGWFLLESSSMIAEHFLTTISRRSLLFTWSSGWGEECRNFCTNDISTKDIWEGMVFYYVFISCESIYKGMYSRILLLYKPLDIIY